MKFAGWSNVHGQPGTSSNLSAIAVYSTMRYGLKSLITQTNFMMNDLEAPLVGNEIRGDEYFKDVGIDALARSIKSGPLDEVTFFNSSISLLNNKLHLLPGTTKSSREHFESDMEKTVTNITRSAERFYDVVFIDTNSGRNEISSKVLANAELIIVNLSQNKRVIDSYFDEYHFDPNKVFFLIGNYDRRRKDNMRNLRRHYKKMKSSNSAAIPYCSEFADAISEGKMIEFFKKNMKAKKDDKNRYFIDCVGKATKKILIKAGWRGEDLDELDIHS